MSKTRHIAQRMSQRGISDKILELVATFGMEHGDKIILNKKGCDKVVAQLQEMARRLIRVSETGGYVLVEAGGKQITAYRLNSYKRP